MQYVLGNFIHTLRQRGIPISPAETLDGLKAAKLIGIHDRENLKAALGMTLAKTQIHRSQLEQSFDEFFSALDFNLESDEKLEETDSKNTVQDSSTTAQENQTQDTESPEDHIESTLGQQLLNDDEAGIQLAIAAAGSGAGAQTMKIFTQKGGVSYRIMQTLGDGPLNAELSALEEANEAPELTAQLRQQRQILQQQVADYVERQYLLYSQAQGLQLREQNLQKVHLTNIDSFYQKQMIKLVRKAAKQLASLHSRRRKITKRGLLDVRKTIAANAAYDGFLFHTKWKSTRIDKPKVVVICDVSGSVSRVARFLLLFLYSLQDVLPRVRSFVFASELGEVTELFEQQDAETALTNIMNNWANMPTDYGRALENFEELALKDIDNKTTVIMLGDARNNNIPTHQASIWKKVYQRSRRVLWLNPERQSSWNTGDSIMSEYAPFCSRVESCNSLRDLTRILSSLLKHA